MKAATQTHSHTDTQPHSQTATHTATATQPHSRTDTQTRSHTDTQPHRHAATQTRSHTDTQPHTHTHTHTYTQPHIYTHSHTATQTHSYTVTHTHTHTQPHSHTATQAHSHTDTHNAIGADKQQMYSTALQQPDIHRQDVQGYQRSDRVGVHTCFIFRKSRYRTSVKRPAILMSFLGFPEFIQVNAGIISAGTFPSMSLPSTVHCHPNHSTLHNR